MDIAPIQWDLVRNLAIALFIGALVGVDRERNFASGRPYFGGLRTFMLIALAGALASWLGQILGTPLVVVAGLVGLVGLLAASYVVLKRADAEDVGLTGEIAAVLVYLLGALCLAGEPALAVVGAIVTSALLAFKDPLHALVAKIGQGELSAALELLFATFIVLPVLPRVAVDPWGALVPYELWWFVILVSGLSFLGWIAVRWLGDRRGMALTGLFGGLTSSTAVTISSARQARAGGEVSALALAVLIAWAVMFARVIVLVGVIEPRLLPLLAPPLAAMALTSGVAAWWSGRGGRPDGHTPLTNPFSLAAAAQVGVVFAIVLVLVELARRELPSEAMYGVAVVGGLVDVDAISLSMARLADGDVGTRVAAGAIVVATVTNTVVKWGILATIGTRELARRAGLAAVAVVGVGVAVAALAWFVAR